MKNIVIILLLIVATNSNAQKIKSVFAPDSIKLPANGFEIRGIVVNAHGDTARSVFWQTGGLGRDISGLNIVTKFYDKNGVFLTDYSQSLTGTQMPNLILLRGKLDSLMKVTQPRIVTQ